MKSKLEAFKQLFGEEELTFPVIIGGLKKATAEQYRALYKETRGHIMTDPESAAAWATLRAIGDNRDAGLWDAVERVDPKLAEKLRAAEQALAEVIEAFAERIEGD